MREKPRETAQQQALRESEMNRLRASQKKGSQIKIEELRTGVESGLDN